MLLLYLSSCKYEVTLYKSKVFSTLTLLLLKLIDFYNCPNQQMLSKNTECKQYKPLCVHDALSIFIMKDVMDCLKSTIKCF